MLFRFGNENYDFTYFLNFSSAVNAMYSYYYIEEELKQRTKVLISVTNIIQSNYHDENVKWKVELLGN